MQELDKGAMGRRIRQIRLGASLRQWELAKLLGTTQSAVHKYEHGVVPEPRRLVELARIGGTSIEWVLTGTHWENGSEEQERISPELLSTACVLRQISEDGRAGLDEALRILREAARALEEGSPEGAASAPHATSLLRLLEQAGRIQHAVLERVIQDAGERLQEAPVFLDRRSSKGDKKPHGSSAAGRSPS